MAKKAKVKAQPKNAKKEYAPKKEASELVVVNGRVKLETTAKSPAHRVAGIEINPIESTARKMIKHGWAKVI